MKRKYSFDGNTEELISCCKRFQISLEKLQALLQKKDTTTHKDIYSHSIKDLSLEAEENFLKL